MARKGRKTRSVERLLDTPDLANALESDRFKQFLDQVPVAVAVAELTPKEHIVYANVEFERLSGEASSKIVGGSWAMLPGVASAVDDDRKFGEAISDGRDFIGSFTIQRDGVPADIDAWSNIIKDDEGSPVFRLVALVDSPRRGGLDSADVEKRLAEKDTLLKELQHRVNNNLQMITALIRVEARGVPDGATGERFDRLAGRVEALAVLYRLLTDADPADAVDLGVYLSQIAAAVMAAHAVEGIHLDLQVDTWPVTINVAMPAGLMVNELLTNALKHAFPGRDGGTITVQCRADPSGCRVVVADDGVGLPVGVQWPRPGKLSSLIVRSLRQNAKASVEVDSAPGQGMRVSIRFACADAAPTAG